MTVRFTACRPEDRALLEDFFAGRVEGRTIKSSKVREVHRIERGGRSLYVKRFLERSLGGRVRSLIRDRAEHEYRILERLERAGVGAARPVAAGRQGGSSFLATEEVEGARELRETFEASSVPALARFVRAVHDAGVRDDDLHVGNILVNGRGLHLIDVHRGRLKTLTERERADGVAFLLHSLQTRITPARALALIYAYHGSRSQEFARRVWESLQRVRQAYWKSRTERCRKESTEFTADGPWLLRRPMTRAAAEEAEEAAGRTVKRLANRSLRVVGDRFVKTCRRSLAEWEHAHALAVRHLPTPTLWAAKRGAVIGEWHERARPLWEAVQERFPSMSRGERSDFLYRLAREVRRLHVRGVFHKDLKANNVLVEGGQFLFIDLDRVALRAEVAERDRLFNLAQLNAAVGGPATRADRLRFYRYYAGNNREWRTNWKRRVRAIMTLTIARRHHWPPRA